MVYFIITPLLMIEKILNTIYRDVRKTNKGNVAKYIPELANIDASKFGISVCLTSGEQFSVGNAHEHFSLQSCSKPLSYCIAYDEHGKDYVHKHVGYEPSGMSFNAHILNKKGLPHNPLINAGAIMISSLIQSDKEPSHRFHTIKNTFSKLAGNNAIGFDNSVFLSEQHHADRNMSLAYFMRENGAYGEKIKHCELHEGLDLYYQQCATTITCEHGAIIAATLANQGACPTTNEHVFSKNSVNDCLSLMRSCGLYDYTGEFAFEVGLPAKSGVSGCVMMVIPNVMGICVWSPLLDERGNSVKGIEVCKLLHKELDVSQKSATYSESARFMQACYDGDYAVVTDMITVGCADINGSDYNLQTPLHLASHNNHTIIVKLLLDEGAISKKDRWGKYPTIHTFEKNLDKYDENNYNNV
jgi:glutaminase|tara:strand:- start:2103 stop:3344 length:1242 start_codon:yes stop_codon:yes gene_type:complete